MDPLSALAIVCATLQFVDFGVEIVTTAQELYSSASGISARLAELQDKAEILTSITMTFSSPDLIDNRKVEAGLVKVVSDCKDVKTQLRALVNDLKLEPPTSPDRKLIGKVVRVLKTIGKSTKTLTKLSVTAELTERLVGLRAEVHSYILYMLK